MCVANSDVLNDHYELLGIMEDWERQNLSNKPLNTLSPYLQQSMSYFKNSTEIKEYIAETDQFGKKQVFLFYTLFSLLTLTFFARIYYRKKKDQVFYKKIRSNIINVF